MAHRPARLLWLPIALGLLGCVEAAAPDAAAPPMEDAGVRPPPDGGGAPPAPTACDWRLGDAVVFGTHDQDFTDITGAVHLTRDEVFVQARPFPGPETVGARIALGETPRILQTFHRDRFGLAVFGSTDDGYASLGACAPTYLDHELNEVSSETWGSASCRFFQSEAGYVTVGVLERDTWELRFERRELSPWALAEPIGTTGIDVNTVDSFVHDPDEGTLVFHYDDTGERWVARPFSSAPPVHLGEVILRDPAVDPVHGGVLQLASRIGAMSRRTTRLEHYAWDEGGPDRVLVEVDGQSTGPLVTTDAEALATFTDGRVMVVPLEAPEARWIGPVDASAAYLRLVLRPGDSVGGVVYMRPAAAGYEVVFRSLVCERG